MSNVEARWSVELWVDCPKCNECFDMNSDDSFANGDKGYALEKQQNLDVECVECGHKFKVDLSW